MIIRHVQMVEFDHADVETAAAAVAAALQGEDDTVEASIRAVEAAFPDLRVNAQGRTQAALEVDQERRYCQRGHFKLDDWRIAQAILRGLEEQEVTDIGSLVGR